MKTTVPVGQGVPVSYGLGHHGVRQTGCGALWGNGGDLPGFSSEFFNTEDGERQAGVIVNVNPIPKAVSGEPLGSAKRPRSRTPSAGTTADRHGDRLHGPDPRLRPHVQLAVARGGPARG